MYRYICPECGASLDPGEKCDCQEIRAMDEKKRQQNKKEMEKLLIEEKNGQLRLAV